jgi:DeoR family transcriptional regulator, aga operon transcriptional repressor
MSDFTPTPERQKRILSLLSRAGRLSVAEIVEQFSISKATARRDLETLASQGKAKRVHGGVVAVEQAPPELPILQRESEQAGEKQRIGQAAAALVQDGETVFLSSGTTVLEAARALRGRHNLTVITNSLAVVNALAGAEGVAVICLGGMLRNSELSFIGHITEQALAELRADKVLIGTRAISLEHGLTHDYLPETVTDRAILKSAREIIVLADHTKFGRAATVLLAPLESIHIIVTDEQTSDEFISAVEERGIKVVKG